MKFRLALFIFTGFVIVVVLAGFWFFQNLAPADPQVTAEEQFVIPPQATAAQVVASLSSRHLIKNPLAAKIYLRLTELDSRLRPGAYLVAPSQSVPDLVKTLISGPKDVWVTLPEGWRREQMAARLAETLAADSAFSPQDFLAQTATLEGRLFPDTYLIPTYATTSNVIRIISANFTAKVPAISASDLILASLVEREAKQAPDRPIIAGILQNRLRAGWPLQVDATVQYVEGTSRCQATPLNCSWWQPPVNTRVSSPYNTYLHPGLPPAPIANPGLASIAAVLHPQVTGYWFYLTGTDGVTRFASTGAEQNLNVDKYLRP